MLREFQKEIDKLKKILAEESGEEESSDDDDDDDDGGGGKVMKKKKKKKKSGLNKLKFDVHELSLSFSLRSLFFFVTSGNGSVKERNRKGERTVKS